MGKRAFLKDWVYQAGQWLELVISILIVLAIIFYAFVLAVELFHTIVGTPAKIEELNEFINLAFNLVIGIEFIKMLCKHSPAIVLEVLMFAVARQMIVEHMSPMQNLISIMGIALLFAIRRYLLFDEDEEFSILYRNIREGKKPEKKEKDD